MKLKIKNKTPLHSAAWNNLKEIGELLISKGADINAIDVKNQFIISLYLITIVKHYLRKLKLRYFAPIHYATENNSKEMLELLISKGADINATDVKFQKFIVIF